MVFTLINKRYALAALTLLSSLSFLVQADGQAIYDKHCRGCHIAGVGGAPKPDDAAAWAPRIAKGSDAMLQTVLSGKGAMPPKGTCMSCSDDELKAAIEILLPK